MKRLVLVAVVVLMTVALALPAGAMGNVRFSMSSAGWIMDCSAGYGLLGVNVDIYVPAGYSYSVGYSDSMGTSYSDSVELAGDWYWNNSAVPFLFVPGDGWSRIEYSVYAPDGLHLASGGAFANCVTDEHFAWGTEITDIQVPDASARVMGTVLYDTGVYAKADPGTQIDGAVLTQGQTWFVVSSATGSNGALWYEVFVAGLYNGWVPAASMSLEDSIPQ